MNLELCPFCGRVPELRDLGVGTGGYIITCRCGVMMSSYAKKHFKEPEIHKEIRENVIKQWNVRVNKSSNQTSAG